MEKLESLAGGITSSLASDKTTSNCTVGMEANLYRLQYSRSTTDKKIFALKNVQHSISLPFETTDWINVQHGLPFETTDWINVQHGILVLFENTD
jgi:hypothetical protein